MTRTKAAKAADPAAPVLVFPVPGRWLTGVPAVPHECTSDLCVASGAFTTDPPPDVPDGADAPPPAEPGSSED